MTQDNKDLCKVCKRYWVDFTIHPDKTYISHCEIVDEKYNFKCLDDIVEYPCLECPFNSFIRKD